MSRIFVSHSAKDGFPTVAIGEWLTEEGWDDVYLDVDPDRGTHPGERWQRALYDHASDCEAVLFLVSRNWLTTEWCRCEYDLARKLNKQVFVVLIDDRTVNDLPTSLRETHQAVSLTGNGLVAALASAAENRGLVVTRAQVREAVKQGDEKTREILLALVGKRSVEDEKPPTLIVAVDQAEELFRPEGAVESEPFLALAWLKPGLTRAFSLGRLLGRVFS